MTAICNNCGNTVIPEDAPYDGRESQYYCDMACFRDWVDDNNEVVTDFYIRLNVTE